MTSNMKRRSGSAVSDSVGQRSGRDVAVADVDTKHSAVDGRFSILPQARSKVAVDDRFSAMLTDPSFGALEVRDKYGRKGKRLVGDNVGELYQLQQNEIESSEQGVNPETSKESRDKFSSSSGKNKAVDQEGPRKGDNRGVEGVKQAAKRRSPASAANPDDGVMSKLKAQDIRSAMNDWTSSSSGSDSSSASGSDEESDDEGLGGVGGIAGSAASTIVEGQETRRLAVMHLDWDRISAKDIFAILHSFLPPSRGLLSVAVYPSEFGKEQMAAERTSGPVVKQQPKSKKKKSSKESIVSSGADAEADFDDELLRAYELNKLRYFYAVAEFDSAETASAVYEQCDGVEFEASSNVLDLRFIPDDTTFDPVDIRDSATSMPTTYAAPVFTTSALQMSKVQLTWDDDDPKRSILKGDKHGRINYADFLASGSSSDDNVGQGGDSSDDDTSRLRPEKRHAFSSLLDSLKSECVDNGDSSGIEMSFASNVQRRAEDVLAAFSSDPNDKSSIKKSKKKEKADEDSLYVDDVEWDPNDPYHAEELEKVGKKSKKKSMRERRLDKMAKEEARKAAAANNAELQLLVDGDTADGHKRGGYSLKPGALDRASAVASGRFAPKQRKGASEVDAGNESGSFAINVDDARFSSIFTDPNFAVDPLNPLFQRTPGMQQVLQASQSKRLKPKSAGSNNNKDSSSNAAPSAGGMSAELKLLVSSVKSKAPRV